MESDDRDPFRNSYRTNHCSSPENSSFIIENQLSFARIARSLSKAMKVKTSVISIYHCTQKELLNIKYEKNEQLVLFTRDKSYEALWQHVKVTEKPLVVSDNKANNFLFCEMPLFKGEKSSLLASVPVFSKKKCEIIGLISLVDESLVSFNDDDLSLMESFAHWVSAEIEIMERIQQEKLDKDTLANSSEMKEEIILAGKIQQTLLPKGFQSKKITLETLYAPRNYVSGDSFGYKWVEEEKLLIYIMDVMGHGVPTAIQTSAINLLFKEEMDRPSSLSEKLNRINRRSVDVLNTDYFTAALIIEVDLANGYLHYCGGGIIKFIYCSNNNPTLIRSPGPFLGMFENSTYHEYKLSLTAGDHIHLLTDGILDHITPKTLNKFTEFESSHQTIQRFTENYRLHDDATALSILYKNEETI